MISNNLEVLRKVLRQKKVDACIIPSTDPHQSEYIPNYWKSREWLTGFTGSAGIAVVTKKHAGLWTDSRYFIQAENQLIPPFILHRQKTRNPEYLSWLNENLNFGDSIGIDGRLFSTELIEYFTSLLGKSQIKIVDIGDFINEIWVDRPPLPEGKVFLHDVEFTGKTRTEKIKEVLVEVKAQNASSTIISSLDDIAWLLNIRGNDVAFNPVVTAHCLLNQNETLLFIDEKKLNDEVKLSLKKDRIKILPYEEVENHISDIKGYTTILIDKSKVSYNLAKAIPNNCEIISAPGIVESLKAIKNPVEINNYKNAQIRDGLAMCNFLHWLDTHIDEEEITEIQAAETAEKFRSVQENYMGLSFETISAYGPNAALPHYSVSPESNCKLEKKGMYLIDSGAQYLDGTTDITRTVPLGSVSQNEKDDFTLVLKGHIRLASAKFPEGTRGYQLDGLAREALWQEGKNFGHGTGHGIGYFLNVHEGPQGIAPAANGPGGNEIKPGMMITNEPGIYYEGKYGIRIENVLLCVEDEHNKSGRFFKFETVTYCPIDKQLINKSLLTPHEIEWVNNYHKKVYDLLEPLSCITIKDWLKEQTKPL